MGFGEISRRPLRRVVRVGVVEADYVFSALAAFALNTNQFPRVDVVAVLGESVRVLPQRAVEVTTRVPSSSMRPEQDAAAFVGIGFLAVLAEGVVVLWREFQHEES